MGQRLTAQNVRLRSVNRSNSTSGFIVNSSGVVNSNDVHNANRCAPDCVKTGRHMVCAQRRCLQYLTQGAESPAERPNNCRSDAVGPAAGTAITLRLLNMTAEEIISFEALYDSMEKCKCGVLWKDSAAHFYLNGIEECLKLEAELETEKYVPREPRKFLLTHPKRREAISISFRDRVYQRSLNDNAIYPEMTRSFIYDNHSCQKGKGTDKARERLKCHMERFCRRDGPDGWVLQGDIKGYYPNMPHEVAFRCFRKHLDPAIAERSVEVLRGQYAGETGFNPGSQMVQIVGISALDEMDHYIKEKLGIKYYIRYMDDFILIHRDRSCLEDCLQEMRTKLTEIGLELHPEKTGIYKLSDGIPFLGFIFRADKTGHVTMLIKPKNVKNERRKLRRMAGLVKDGRLSKEKADESYRDWRAHAAKGDSKSLLDRMDAFYEDLWKEGT